ncbi:MAG: flagellin lysine-N-methylase [Clostridia bacterium]|nr:flagellin lysine-N-methylase [Clostridia bacterium]
MTIIPAYYRAFHCLADRCRHNCCIGWEIDIDPDTYSRYTAVKGDFGNRLRDGIVHEDRPCFRLDKHDRCVFLNERGLCDIICTLGEDALCDICTDHPRFRTYIGDDLRLGLGLCCEAACRLILDSPVRFINADTGATVEVDTAVPPFSDTRTPADWAALYRSLERLDPAWDAYLDKLGVCSSFTEERGVLWERLTAYFVFRHAHPRFAAHAAALILTLAEGAEEEELGEICRLYSAEIEYSDENLDAVIDRV